jgi:predicted amidohydrolase YtcJ
MCIRGTILAGGILATGLVYAQDVADTIYSGGSVLTINDSQPTAEAVAAVDGQILAVGTLAELSRYQGSSTRMFDLAGRTLLPGFVDSHGHVVMGGL